VPDLQKVTHR